MIVKKFGEFLAIPRYGFLTTVLRMYLPQQQGSLSIKQLSRGSIIFGQILSIIFHINWNICVNFGHFAINVTKKLYVIDPLKRLHLALHNGSV